MDLFDSADEYVSGIGSRLLDAYVDYVKSHLTIDGDQAVTVFWRLDSNPSQGQPESHRFFLRRDGNNWTNYGLTGILVALPSNVPDGGSVDNVNVFDVLNQWKSEVLGDNLSFSALFQNQWVEISVTMTIATENSLINSFSEVCV